MNAFVNGRHHVGLHCICFRVIDQHIRRSLESLRDGAAYCQINGDVWYHVIQFLTLVGARDGTGKDQIIGL